MPPPPSRSRLGLAGGGTFFDMKTEMVEIPGFPGYAVDREGNVYSLERKIWHPRNGWVTKQSRKLRPTLNSDGYANVKLYLAGKHSSKKVHRLIASTFLGLTARQQVDHINRTRSDNRLTNLRIATRAQNQYNMPAKRKGLKGAYAWDKRWRAQIRVSGKLHNLGLFDTEQEAHEAYVKAAKPIHGEFYFSK